MDCTHVAHTEHFMPASSRVSRKGQFSCNFCRKRKLRCDRPLPCTSCRSRGKTCEFDPTPTDTKIVHPDTTIATKHASQEWVPHIRSSTDAITTNSAISAYQISPSTQTDLLAQLQALRKLTQDMEQRVTWSSVDQQRHDCGEPAYTTVTVTRPNNGLLTLVSEQGDVGDIVSHLQLVSMSRVSQTPVGLENIVFRIENVRNIPRAPPFIVEFGKLTACVWLPTHAEAKMLLDHYIKSLSRFQHIVHQPSLPGLIDDIYKQFAGKEPLKPGHIIMLLSIIASATHIWISEDDDGSDSSLFPSPEQAHAQTPMWIRATHTVLNAVQTAADAELESIQGIVILGCVLCNIEGVSLRYRQLMSTAMVLGRQLGLHRTDQAIDVNVAGILRTEMGRRVWWYLVATDWCVWNSDGSERI